MSWSAVCDCGINWSYSFTFDDFIIYFMWFRQLLPYWPGMPLEYYMIYVFQIQNCVQKDCSIREGVTPPKHFSIDHELSNSNSVFIQYILISTCPSPTSKVSKGAKIRNLYNQVPHLTQDTNGKVTNSQQTPQTRAKRTALSQQVTTKHI